MYLGKLFVFLRCNLRGYFSLFFFNKNICLSLYEYVLVFVE